MTRIPVLPHLHPADRLRSALNVIRPQAGAVANARKAVLTDQRVSDQRRDAAVLQARALGPRAWTPIDRSTSPIRDGPGHAVHFYDSDAELVARLASYVADGLADGEVGVVIATPAHRAGLRQRLALAGLADAAGSGRLLELDADEVLRRFMRDGWPDPELFDIAVAEVVRSSLRAGVGLRAFGEIAAVLHAQGNLAGALQVEKLWDALQLRLGFPLLCAYPVLDPPEEDDDVRPHVCARHSHLAAAVG